MTSTIIYKPHKCDLPGSKDIFGQPNLPYGTIAQCDECKQEWRLEEQLLIGAKWIRFTSPLGADE